MDKAALGVAGFRPWVGEQQEQPVQACVGQAAQQDARVVGPEEEVGRERGDGLRGALRHQGGEQGADAVLEHLAGDQGRFGVGSDLGDGVFTAAEADFEPKRAGRECVAQGEARQGEVEQAFLAGTQLVAARPAVEAIRRGFDVRNQRIVQMERLRLAARSPHFGGEVPRLGVIARSNSDVAI